MLPLRCPTLFALILLISAAYGWGKPTTVKYRYVSHPQWHTDIKKYSDSHTVRVEKVGKASWTINRHGKRVPIIKDPNAETVVEPGAAPMLHLKYLTLRGLGDLPALILEVGSLSYKATYYSKKDFKEFKPTFEFGRLPVLEVEGKELSQSSAIVRFLAEKTGMAGDGLHKARVDALYETYKDLFVSHGVWGRSFNITALKEGPAKDESAPTFRETSNGGEYSNYQKAVVALKTFEDILAGQQEQAAYLVGGHLTYVDLALWQKLHDLGQKDAMGPGWADKLGFPHLGKFTEKINKFPEIIAFVHSGRRMPLTQKVDGEYMYVQDEALITQPTVPKIGNAEL